MIEARLLGAALGRVLAEPGLAVDRLDRLGGGCIDTVLAVAAGRHRVVVKLAADRPRLEAEADGLAALGRCPALRIPVVYGIDSLDDGGQSLLVLEHLPLRADGDEAELGRAVAALHELRGPHFGWSRANFIGTTPQANDWSDDWAGFVAEHRLRPQLALAARHGAGDLARLAEPLLAALPGLFASAAPMPSLLHGDLWRGNAGFADGRPVLFDPAVHYGDSEADLAMCELFGGFSRRFYAAYDEVRRPAPEPAIRRGVYALYHVLNHYNLFGGAYASQARQLIARLRDAVAAR